MPSRRPSLRVFSTPIDPVQRLIATGRNAMVTFVTAGYPTLEDSVPILKAMQDGGVDIIELGAILSVTSI